MMIDAAVGRMGGGSAVMITEVSGCPSLHRAVADTKGACASAAVSRNAAASGKRRSVVTDLDIRMGVGFRVSGDGDGWRVTVGRCRVPGDEFQ